MHLIELQEAVLIYIRVRNWPRLIVRDDQQSGKDEFSFIELVLPESAPAAQHVKMQRA